MALKDKDGNWLDSRGRPVPVDYIRKLDKERDRVVEFGMRRLEKLHQQMIAIKAEIYDKIQQHNQKVMAEYGTEKLGKGNQILTSFSGDKQLEVKINDRQDVNEKFIVFEAALDQWLDNNLKGSKQSIKQLVKRATRRDKQGNRNIHELFRLRQMKIENDPEWDKLMDLLMDCIEVVGNKKYIQARRRKSIDDKFETIDLNFSTV